MVKTQIHGKQIKDDSIESVDIATGSIKAEEMHAEAISGQTTITSTDTSNDYLLIWDATDSALKKVAVTNLGVGTSWSDLTYDGSSVLTIPEYLSHHGDADTYVKFTDDKIEIYAGGRQMIKCVQDSTEKITINNGGMDVDLQIKGENEPNLIRTDAANDRVGICSNSPETELHINGSLTFAEKSSDPSNPSEGHMVIWMSNGDASGDDGDIMIKITAADSTKTITLVDFSAS